MLLEMSANDLELLRQFTREKSQDAFAALVKEYALLPLFTFLLCNTIVT